MMVSRLTFNQIYIGKYVRIGIDFWDWWWIGIHQEFAVDGWTLGVFPLKVFIKNELWWILKFKVKVWLSRVTKSISSGLTLAKQQPDGLSSPSTDEHLPTTEPRS